MTTTSLSELVRRALTQALWHIGTDADRIAMAQSEKWVTSTDGCCELLRAALTHTEVQGDLGEPQTSFAWQKIETAPKDKGILVTGGTYTWDCDYPDILPFPRVALVYWSKRDERWQGDSTGYQDEYYWYEPTHWMPLPEPPVHDSDCALHNAPALPNGPCDCSVSSSVAEGEAAPNSPPSKHTEVGTRDV